MCGNKGDPLPPFSKDPSVPEVSAIQQVQDRFLVLWKSVTTFDDGRKIPVPGEVTYVVSVNFGERSYTCKQHYFVDPVKVLLGEKRCYSVTAVYRGHRSLPCEPVCLVAQEPIEEVPKVKSAVAGDGFVEIQVSRCPGCEVEVFKDADFPYAFPYRILSGKGVFRDESVLNRSLYVYRFRFSRGCVKGRLSEPVTLMPVDKDPPLPPPSAILLRKRSSCLLIWEPSPSKDVVLYRIRAGARWFTAETDRIYFYLSQCPSGTFYIHAVDKAENASDEIPFKEVKDEEGGDSDGQSFRHRGNG